MIDIGTTDFYISVPHLSKRGLQRYSTDLFDQWESRIEHALVLPDYSLSLQIEEGSIKGTGQIAAWLGAIYLGIGAYGSFITGLQTIGNQANAVGEFLAESAGAPFSSTGIKPKVRKRSGTLGALQRLFVRVQRGEITPEQAIQEAEALLGDEAQSSPEFMYRFRQSIIEAPLFPKQIPLPLEEREDQPLRETQKERAPRTPREPTWPPPTQFRVEVWRESKKKKRNVRVVEL